VCIVCPPLKITERLNMIDLLITLFALPFAAAAALFLFGWVFVLWLLVDDWDQEREVMEGADELRDIQARQRAERKRIYDNMILPRDAKIVAMLRKPQPTIYEGEPAIERDFRKIAFFATLVWALLAIASIAKLFSFT